jgi:hypothetical protein
MLINTHISSTSSEQDKQRFCDMLFDYGQNRWSMHKDYATHLLTAICNDSTDFVKWFDTTHGITIEHRTFSWSDKPDDTVNLFEVTEDKHFTLYMMK